jgi:hypothetical protein
VVEEYESAVKIEKNPTQAPVEVLHLETRKNSPIRHVLKNSK